MPKPIKVGRKERMSFGKIDEVWPMPNLIGIQTNSYKWFVEEGLKEVFHNLIDQEGKQKRDPLE